MNWQNKLTAAQKKHCKEHQIYTKNDMIETRRMQNTMRANSDYPDREVCHECRAIALIIGIES